MAKPGKCYDGIGWCGVPLKKTEILLIRFTALNAMATSEHVVEKVF